MASSVLYAPTVDTYMPAFLAAGNGTGEASCKIYFSLSKFNTINDISIFTGILNTYIREINQNIDEWVYSQVLSTLSSEG